MATTPDPLQKAAAAEASAVHAENRLFGWIRDHKAISLGIMVGAVVLIFLLLIR